MKFVLSLVALTLVAGPASANEWKALTSVWSYAPGTIQEDTVVPKQGEKFKRMYVWMKSFGKPMTVQVYAVCADRHYEIVRLMEDDGKIVEGASRLDFPPGHWLFPLIEAVDRVCKERRTWWPF